MSAQGGKQIQREGCKTATSPVTESQRLVSKRTGSWNLEKGADSVEIPSLFFYNSTDSLAVSETACELEKVSTSCQSDDSHNACNEQISLNRTCSFPYVEASSKEKPIKSNLQNGDLSSLFSDDNLANEFSGSKDIVLPKEYVRKVSSERISKSNLREIVKKINLLQECRNSLQNHFKVFISDEFAKRQFQFLKGYELLLHQKNVELFSELKNLCERNLRREKIWGLFNSKARQMIEQNGNIPPTHQRDSFVSEVFQDRFFETENVKETIKDLSIVEKTPGNADVMDIIMPNVRLNRRYSYCRAIENSENTWDFDEQEIKKNDGEVQEDESLEKLTESALQVNSKIAAKASVRKKNKTPNSTQKSSRGGKKDGRRLSKSKEKRRKIKSDGKEKNNKKGQNRKKVKNEKKPQNVNVIKDVNNKQTKEIKKPFFFSLCPGGKIENSDLNLENLCEACKISHYHVM